MILEKEIQPSISRNTWTQIQLNIVTVDSFNSIVTRTSLLSHPPPRDQSPAACYRICIFFLLDKKTIFDRLSGMENPKFGKRMIVIRISYSWAEICESLRSDIRRKRCQKGMSGRKSLQIFALLALYFVLTSPMSMLLALIRS